MDIRNVRSDKSPKVKDEMPDYAEGQKFVAPKEKKEWLEKPMPKKSSRFESTKKVASSMNKWLYKKSHTDVKQLNAKLEKEKIKAQIAQQKAIRRQSSPLSRIGKLSERVHNRPSNLPQRVQIETARLKQEQNRRARQEMNAQMSTETEYHRKFGYRNEGDGEMPYYEKEYMRPLPKKPVPTKKKSLKEELF